MNKSGKTTSSIKRRKCKGETIASGLSQSNLIDLKIESQHPFGSSSMSRPFSQVSLRTITSSTTVSSIWLLQTLPPEGFLPTYLLKNMRQRSTTMKTWTMIWTAVWMNATNWSMGSTRTLSTSTVTWETKTKESIIMIPKTIINPGITQSLIFTIRDRIQRSAKVLIAICLWPA